MNNSRNISGVNISSVALTPIFFVAFAALTACGGGGGGDSTPSPSASPTASSSAVLTAEDIPASDVLKASDPEGDPLTFSIVSNASMGTAVITDSSKGTFIYTPAANKSGTDNFTFLASDGTSNSNSATVTITITPVGDDAPVAQDASLNTNEDTPLTGILPASDPDGDSLTYSLVSNGSLGNAVITNAATGAFTYTPLPDSNGSDSFTFKVSDNTLLESNIGTVTVTINPVNDPPLASGSCDNTSQPATSGALPPYVGTLTATDPESDPLTYSLPDGSTDRFLITAKGAEVNIDPTTGDYTYEAKSLADGGERGLDSFTFQVTDPDGATSTATETVVVNQTIMPLGDSITVGYVGIPTTLSTVGYRLPLYDELITSRFLVDFVGSGKEGRDVPGFDFNHEGHGGWTASDIASGRDDPTTEGVFNWLNGNPADIILLHAGTNDLINTSKSDIKDILDEIDRWEASPTGNHVTVILARIIDQDPHNQNVTDLNIAVAAMAEARIDDPSNPDDIIIVDQEFGAGLVYKIGEDMGDKLHPNANGYEKMKNVWLDALTGINLNTNEAVLDQCP